MATVGFERLCKTFPGDVRAVADLDLQVRDGELLVLVGPSGCGKSTLLRLLAGLEVATSGLIRIGERIVNELSPQARNVAMVFQDYALYPHMTARKNLEFPLKMRKLARAARTERVEAVARLLEITHLLDRLPRHLSGGQRQRVAMGRALVRDPSVFLLDEPLSNLDARLRIQVRAEIKDLQRRMGTTMLYVTHDQVEAMTLGDRVAVLHQGRLQQVAGPAELYTHPANVFVASFIGNPPMNLFPTRFIHDPKDRPALMVGTYAAPITPAHVREPIPEGPLTGGIRPEAIRLATPDATADALPVVVTHVEHLGHETLAHLEVEALDPDDPARRLIGRFSGMRYFERGEPLHVLLDPGRLHLFDAAGTALHV